VLPITPEAALVVVLPANAMVAVAPAPSDFAATGGVSIEGRCCEDDEEDDDDLTPDECSDTDVDGPTFALGAIGVERNAARAAGARPVRL